MVTPDILEWVVANVSRGRRVAIATIIGKEGSAPRDVGTSIAILSDGSKKGTIGGGEIEEIVIRESIKALQESRPRRIKIALTGENVPADSIRTNMICGGAIEVFIDVVNPAPRVIIIGAGHVGKPLGDIANMLGYKVVVLDDKPDLITSERFPYADRILGDVVKSIETLELNDSDVIIITYGEPEIEYQILRKLLVEKKFVGHIWILSSRKKALWISERLSKEGIELGKLNSRIHAPAGLNIGSDTPEEIAVSIIAEIICEFKNCSKPVRTLSIYA